MVWKITTFTLRRDSFSNRNSNHSTITAGEASGDKNSEMLLKRLNDVDEMSHVSLQDFGGDTFTSFVHVERWQVPVELKKCARKILVEGGAEFAIAVKIGIHVQNSVFSTLCGAVRSMESTPVELITESLLLKWRDAIVDATRLGFKVQSLKDHLLYLGKVFVGKSMLMNENSEIEIARRKLEKLELEMASLKEFIEKQSSEPISLLMAECIQAAKSHTSLVAGSGLN